MKKRIYGLETEYGIALIKKNGSWACESTELRNYIDILRGSHASQFLPNGSRLYIEGSFHPEYCTAECVDLADLIAQDKAGEKILEGILTRAVEEMGIHKRVALFKNNVQYIPENYSDRNFSVNAPPTFGCHENFSANIGINEAVLYWALIPFLVARQIVSGSGWVANSHCQASGFRYAISQRTRFITQEIGESTTGGWTRAILCTARWNEPLAEGREYKRLHLILGDSNMSEISTYLKMGTMGILLEMIEEGYPLAEQGRKLMPRSPVEALHHVCFDLT